MGAEEFPAAVCRLKNGSIADSQLKSAEPTCGCEGVVGSGPSCSGSAGSPDSHSSFVVCHENDVGEVDLKAVFLRETGWSAESQLEYHDLASSESSLMVCRSS
jgi:hypothetical protein